MSIFKDKSDSSLENDIEKYEKDIEKYKSYISSTIAEIIKLEEKIESVPEEKRILRNRNGNLTIVGDYKKQLDDCKIELKGLENSLYETMKILTPTRGEVILRLRNKINKTNNEFEKVELRKNLNVQLELHKDQIKERTKYVKKDKGQNVFMQAAREIYTEGSKAASNFSNLYNTDSNKEIITSGFKLAGNAVNATLIIPKNMLGVTLKGFNKIGSATISTVKWLTTKEENQENENSYSVKPAPSKYNQVKIKKSGKELINLLSLVENKIENTNIGYRR